MPILFNMDWINFVMFHLKLQGWTLASPSIHHRTSGRRQGYSSESSKSSRYVQYSLYKILLLNQLYQDINIIELVILNYIVELWLNICQIAVFYQQFLLLYSISVFFVHLFRTTSQECSREQESVFFCSAHLLSLYQSCTQSHGNIFELKVCADAQSVYHNTSNVLDHLSSLKVIHLTTQHTLSALFQMLVYISVWEFICSMCVCLRDTSIE